MVVSTADFKKGLRIVYDGAPYQIVDFQHVKPGKGGAFVRTKLKHMRQGAVIDNTFRAGEKVELVEYEEKRMQYLYKDDRYDFMDTETYEQVPLSAEEVGDARDFLKENIAVDVLFIELAVAVELPNFVELQDHQDRSGRARRHRPGGTKPATLETGAVVQVPLFVNEGDVVKVDTRTGDYLDRVAVGGDGDAASGHSTAPGRRVPRRTTERVVELTRRLASVLTERGWRRSRWSRPTCAYGFSGRVSRARGGCPVRAATPAVASAERPRWPRSAGRPSSRSRRRWSARSTGSVARRRSLRPGGRRRQGGPGPLHHRGDEADERDRGRRRPGASSRSSSRTASRWSTASRCS